MGVTSLEWERAIPLGWIKKKEKLSENSLRRFPSRRTPWCRRYGKRQVARKYLGGANISSGGRRGSQTSKNS